MAPFILNLDTRYRRVANSMPAAAFPSPTLPPETPVPTGGWASPRTCLVVLEKNLLSLPGFEPRNAGL